MPWDLDVAMLRRLEKRVFKIILFKIQILVPLPDLEAREAMLRRYLPLELSENLEYRSFAE